MWKPSSPENYDSMAVLKKETDRIKYLTKRKKITAELPDLLDRIIEKYQGRISELIKHFGGDPLNLIGTQEYQNLRIELGDAVDSFLKERGISNQFAPIYLDIHNSARGYVEARLDLPSMILV